MYNRSKRNLIRTSTLISFGVYKYGPRQQPYAYRIVVREFRGGFAVGPKKY